MQAEANLDQTVLDIVDARVGTVIRNKWHVDALLGTGGMAAVYAATHRNGNRVALKVLHLQLSIDHALSQRFKREGYAANAVQHPGVVRVLDDDVTEDGAAFLVMELLDGETTADRAERLGGRLPVQDALPIIEGVLDILSAAHAGGIVHRDIKPENIFFTRDRVVKLLDFGIAHMRGSKGSAAHTAAAMGTPAFMPPEQALGHMDKVDALSDVWSTGATMYTLLAGRLVHEHDTANEVLIAAATRPALSLATVAPDVPLEIVEIVDRALSYEKKKRWSSAKAMQHALGNAKESAGSSWGRISLLAVVSPEASGSHPRVLTSGESPESVPGVAVGETLPGSKDRVNTLAEGITVPKAAPRQAGRVALISVLLAALAVLATLAVLGILGHVRVGGGSDRNGGSDRSSANGDPAAASPSGIPQPNPMASPGEQAVTPEPEPSPSVPADVELANEADLPEASTKPAKLPAVHGVRPPPRDPPREKTWLDRRK